MIALKLGWYAPHRAGGWGPWLFDLDWCCVRPAPTYYVEATLLGLTLHLEMGWGEWGYEW